MKLTIGQKILLGYGLAMLFMAITGIAAYRSTRTPARSQRLGAAHLSGDRRGRGHPRRSARDRKRLPGIPDHRRCAFPGIDRGLTGAPGREPEADSIAYRRQSQSTAQARHSGSADRPPARRPDARSRICARRRALLAALRPCSKPASARQHRRDPEFAGGDGERGTHSSGWAGANRAAGRAEHQSDHSIRKSAGFCIGGLYWDSRRTVPSPALWANSSNS